MKSIVSAFALSILIVPAAHASVNEFEPGLRNLVGELSAWVADPAIIAAVKVQNAAHAGLNQGRIDELDKEWRAQVGAPSAPLIEKVLGRPESGWLRNKQDASAGLITEVFVMDNLGLNVAQSEVTSDYWQGDEAKWQQTYLVGASAVHISEVEFDESAQVYQSQVSLPVIDPADGSVIGAVTFGINVELLQ